MDPRVTAQSFFISRGWSPAQAAGIVGNLAVESGFDPLAVGDQGTAFGLAQWRGPRQRDLMGFAQANGLDYRDARTQLMFVDYELRTTEKEAGDRLRAAQSVPAATEAVMLGYERPNMRFAHSQKRLGHAMAAVNANPPATGDFVEGGVNAAAGAMAGTPEAVDVPALAGGFEAPTAPAAPPQQPRSAISQIFADSLRTAMAPQTPEPAAPPQNPAVGDAELASMADQIGQSGQVDLGFADNQPLMQSLAAKNSFSAPKPLDTAAMGSLEGLEPLDSGAEGAAPPVFPVRRRAAAPLRGGHRVKVRRG